MSTRPPSSETAAIHDQKNQKGAGVLLYCSVTKRMLLGRRGMDCSSPETWAPFGGMVDPGEVPYGAALREVWEEAGVRIIPGTKGLITDPVYVNRDEATGFEFYTYLCVLNIEPQVTINDESSGYCWFRFDDLPEKLHPGFKELLESDAGRFMIKQISK